VALSAEATAASPTDPSTPARADIVAGDSVGPFRIVEEIGRGGIGIVNRAQHAETHEEVALKTLPAALPADRESLRREMSELGRIRHPGIVRLVAQGVRDGIPWYAMELIRGPTLEDQLAARWTGARVPRGNEAALRTLHRLCDPLGFLHGEGSCTETSSPPTSFCVRNGSPSSSTLDLSAAWRSLADRRFSERSEGQRDVGVRREKAQRTSE